MLNADHITHTSSNQFEHWKRREVPSVEEVAEGIFAIPSPVTVGVKFVYSYLFTTSEGAILLDPGQRLENSTEALETGFAQIGFDPHDIKQIVISHFHFDHWEGADLLATQTGAKVAISEAEWEWVSLLERTKTSVAGMTPWFESLGADRATAIDLAATADYKDTYVYDSPDVLLKPDEIIQLGDLKLQVIATPGHSPGHISLYEPYRKLLFSADHILPGITPHIALNRFGLRDPLAAYKNSLHRVQQLEVLEVLPAHEYRFSGLAARVRELFEDIDKREKQISDILEADPQLTPWQLAKQLTWARGWGSFSAHLQRMALDETAAHLRHLGKI